MKTVDIFSGCYAKINLASGNVFDGLILSADTLGIWVSETHFVPWASVEDIEVKK